MNTPAHTAARPAETERAIAIATSITPLATGIVAPFLDGGAAFTATLAYAGTAGFLAANYMNRLPPDMLDKLPGADIVQAHRSPMFISTLTTGIALALGTIGGPAGADALMAGALTLPSIPGIVSLGWWAAVALVPFKLRTVLSRRPRTHIPAPTALSATAATRVLSQVTPEERDILQAWGHNISHPDHGSHRGQILTLNTLTPQAWTGTITAPAGQSVTVTTDTVSSVYQRHASWITFAPGTHAGERRITVNLIPPAELDPTTLAGAWKKWVSRTGGLMAGTRLADIQDDPHTGGQVALIVAGEDQDRLRHPDRIDLAGALRTTPLLISYEPRTNPRKAVVRTMDRNPLEQGTPFPGPDALRPSTGGYIRIGTAVSGRPVRAQLLDPKLGARHLIVTGVTGSGKGGALQLIALAAHLNSAVIIYGDPKGSSNPSIEEMAAYSGLGEEGAIGALRVARALVEHRIDLTAKLKLKNFDPTVMPHVVFILDEASSLMGENAQHVKEAADGVDLIARKGRSLGVSLVLANQILQLAQLGGKASIRDNVVGSGGVIMLRSDSSQRNLIDLPVGMESCNPADIPATWSGDDTDTLVYTDDTQLTDPESTFGLGYFMTTDGICAMGRTFNLEDASPYINPDAVIIPTDWPDWDQRHEIATQPAGDDTDSDLDAGPSTLFGAPDPAPAKPASADEKILQALRDSSDPLGIEVTYMHKDQIKAMTGLAKSTVENALSRLVKDGQLHRQTNEQGFEIRGMYGLGAVPAPDNGE